MRYGFIWPSSTVNLPNPVETQRASATGCAPPPCRACGGWSPGCTPARYRWSSSGTTPAAMSFRTRSRNWPGSGTNVSAAERHHHHRATSRAPAPFDQRLQHLPAGDTVQVTDDRVQLDLRVFEDLLQPQLLPGLLADQAAPVAGHVPKPADRLGVHQTGPAHPTLDHLGPTTPHPACRSSAGRARS